MDPRDPRFQAQPAAPQYAPSPPPPPQQPAAPNPYQPQFFGPRAGDPLQTTVQLIPRDPNWQPPGGWPQQQPVPAPQAPPADETRSMLSFIADRLDALEQLVIGCAVRLDAIEGFEEATAGRLAAIEASLGRRERKPKKENGQHATAENSKAP
jgi:hypothetical protein